MGSEMCIRDRAILDAYLTKTQVFGIKQVVYVLRESDEQIIREPNAQLKNFWHNRNQAHRNSMNIVQGIASNIHHSKIKLGDVEEV